MKNSKNYFFLLLLAFGTSVMISCDDTKDPDPINTVTKDGIIASQEDDDLDPLALEGSVEANITLDAATEWILSGPLSVKSGFTLTIEAGTMIKAEAGGTNVYIAVEQGGMIDASGTAASPITITSAAANPRAGDWGGLILCGKAPISGEAAGATSTTEVLPLSYGGTDAADNSGTITYVELWYTGARINGEKEFNGFTFYGVGSGTIVNHVASFYGDDDAYEWFGGTVEVTNALAVNARDDMFDWTQGWSGSGSNFYGMRTEGYTSISEDTRGIEGDGNLDGNSPTHINQSNPTLAGISIINQEPLVDFADLIKVRRGSAASITNAYVKDVSVAGDFVDFTDSKGNATGVSLTVVGDGTVVVDDVKAGDAADGNTVNATAGTTGGADFSVFSWTSWQ